MFVFCLFVFKKMQQLHHHLKREATLGYLIRLVLLAVTPEAGWSRITSAGEGTPAVKRAGTARWRSRISAASISR